MNRLKLRLHSGCTDDMSGNPQLFEEVFHMPTNPDGTIGDNHTCIPIKGFGVMDYMLSNILICKLGYFFVPGLKNTTTLLSFKQHIKYQ